MATIARHWATATTIAARYATLKASVICAVGTKGSVIRMAAVIGKIIWKLRLMLMAFS